MSRLRVWPCLVLLLSILGPTPAAAQANWGTVHRDGSHTGSVPEGPAAPLKQAWKAGPGSSDDFTTWPVAFGGVIYASSGPGIIAVDAESGDQLWFFEIAEGQNVVGPAVDDRGVYVPIRGNQILALDRRTGRELWRFDAENEIQHSPSLLDGRLYFASLAGRVLYAVDASTGSLVWQVSLDSEPFNIPAVGGGLVVFSTWLRPQDAFLIALNAENGEESWRVRLFQTSSSPTILDDKVIVGTGDQTVDAYELSTGRRVWSTPVGNLVASESSPAIAFGDVFVNDRVGNFYRLDGQTGREEWHFFADDGTYVQSSPVVAGDTMYIGGGAGWLHAIDAGSGEQLWRHQVGGFIHFGAADEQRIYFGVKFNNEGLYAYEHDPEGSLVREDEPEAGFPWAGVLLLVLIAAIGILVFRFRSGRPKA